MRKLVGGIVVVAALFGSAAPADAATLRELRRDCRGGDADACEELAFKLCVRQVRRAGFSGSEARDICGG